MFVFVLSNFQKTMKVKTNYRKNGIIHIFKKTCKIYTHPVG